VLLISIIKGIIVFGKSLYVRNRALTSTSDFLKFQCQQTVNFLTYPKLNKWKVSTANGKYMNIKLRSGLSQNKGAGKSLGTQVTLTDKWDKILVDMYSGENRGTYEGEFESNIIYISGFSSGILEDLNSWINDLQSIIEAMVDHATGNQMDVQRFSEWMSMDLTPFIDAEHEDSLGIFVPLANPRIFSFSGPTISTVDGITDIAPVYSIFPEHFLAQFPRFKARIIFSCQAINPASEDHIRLSGNIGAIRGFPIDQYNGGALTSAIFNLVSQHMQGTTSSNTWILLKVVQTAKRSREVFGIVKSCAEAAQRTLERKMLNLEMSTPTLFHMPPLHMLLAPDMASARNAASILILPATLPALRIEHWPRGHDAREMLRMVAQDSRPDSLLAIKMIWVHREMMTTPAELTHSPGDTLYLFIPDGNRPEGIFCGATVNFGRGRAREILGPDPILAYSVLRRQLQEEHQTHKEDRLSAGTAKVSSAGMTGKATGQPGRSVRGRGIPTSSPRPPAIEHALTGGFTLVKSKANIKAARKPATWGGQAQALPTLLGIPSLANHKSKLLFSPPPPSKIRVPVGIRTDISLAEFPALDSKPKTETMALSTQWTILQYPQEALGMARDQAKPNFDEEGIQAPGLFGRCLALGITDTAGACMAYWAARTQITLLAELYPGWSKPTVPINMEFFLETKLLAPKLSGAQRIIRLSPIEDSVATRCEMWGANTPSQIKAVLTVLQEQYGALLFHWSNMITQQGQSSPPPVDYVPHLLRLQGTEMMKLLTGLLPVKPSALLLPEDQLVGDILGVPNNLKQALRILIDYLIAEATTAKLPPGGMRIGDTKFQHEDIPWADLEMGLPQADQLVLSPQVQQHFKAFKAYNNEAQGILLRALIWVERAVYWSRRQDELETRGSYLFPACLSTTTSSALRALPDTIKHIEYPGLQQLCSQYDLSAADIQLSIALYPCTWSELGSKLTNWTTQPELLPWSVENNPPIFSLLQEAGLENDAAEIYISLVSQPTLWAEALAPHSSDVPWNKDTEYGPTTPNTHKDILKHYFPDMDTQTVDFFSATMTHRAAHWRRAIIGIQEFNKIPVGNELVRTKPLILSYYMWALGAHKMNRINSLLHLIMKHANTLTIILDLITKGEPMAVAPPLSDGDISLGGALPAGEYFDYIPPKPTENVVSTEENLREHTDMSNE